MGIISEYHDQNCTFGNLSALSSKTDLIRKRPLGNREAAVGQMRRVLEEKVNVS